MLLLKLTLTILLTTTSLVQSEGCGIQKIKTRELITRGYDTYPGQFPWHVAIFHRKSKARTDYACGGSIISSNFVLTAGHCVRTEEGHEISGKRLVVYAGLHDKQYFGANFQQHSVYGVHTVVGKDQWANLRNDIALVELNSNVGFTDYVQPICLNSLDESSNEIGMVAGWGRTEDDETSDTLKASSMPIVKTADCLASDRNVFGAALDSGTVCAGYRNGTSVCNGDSGGGLIVQRCSVSGCSWSLVGIVSIAAGNPDGTCRTDGYGVFTKVQTYLPWIKQVTGLEFADHQLTDVCGQRRNESVWTRWPWHGTLYRIDFRSLNEGFPVKDGLGVTLLTDRFVITTGIVCKIVQISPAVHRIKFGGIDRDIFDRNTQGMSIEAAFMNSVNIHHMDDYQGLALFKLSGRLTFSDYVQPICLWQGDSSSDNVEKQLTFSVSQVRIIPGYKPDEFSMFIVPLKECVKENKTFSAGANSQIFCGKNRYFYEFRHKFWDIGTGLVAERNNHWYLRGLYSMDIGYMGDLPELRTDHSMFLNVTHYYKWIVSTIESNS